MDDTLSLYLRIPDTSSAQQLPDADDEDSEAIWISAESDMAALEWGREVSERFVNLLFNDPSVSWKSDEFAHWLEDQNTVNSSSDIPMVNRGEFPDFNPWLRRHS